MDIEDIEIGDVLLVTDGALKGYLVTARGIEKDGIPFAGMRSPPVVIIHVEEDNSFFAITASRLMPSLKKGSVEMNWIKVEDRMPEHLENVLAWVIYHDGNATFSDSWWDEEDEEWAMGSAKDYTVTHWMIIEEPN